MSKSVNAWRLQTAASCFEEPVVILGEAFCHVSWVAHTYGDQHVTRTDVDPLRDRAILVLSSNSAPPVVTSTTGCTKHLLRAWDSQAPANFGGDTHQWWSAYYIVPTAAYGDPVDFDASGPAQYMNWYTADHDLPAGLGTYGDGVELEFIQDLFYGGSGVLVNRVTGSLSSQYGDLVQFFQDYGYRTFDDLYFVWEFHQGSEWNRDGSRFNAIPTPIDWHFTDTLNDGGSHTVSLVAQVTVDPVGGLSGSARGLATMLGVRLRGLCA